MGRKLTSGRRTKGGQNNNNSGASSPLNQLGQNAYSSAAEANRIRLQQMLDKAYDEGKQAQSEADADKYRFKRSVGEKLGPQGTLTGGSDMLWVMGSAATAITINKWKARQNADIAWAIGEILLGGLVAMSLSQTGAAKEQKLGTAPTLLNASLGVSVAGLTYLLTRK